MFWRMSTLSHMLVIAHDRHVPHLCGKCKNYKLQLHEMNSHTSHEFLDAEANAHVLMFNIPTRKLAVSLNDITTLLGTSTLYFAPTTIFSSLSRSHDYPLSAASARFYIFFREMKPQFNGKLKLSCIDNFIQRQIIECERLE